MGRFAEADARCALVAEVQHGVFNHSQAIAAGHTRNSIAQRLENGRWSRVAPGVYAINGTPLTWSSRCMTATLWDPGKVIISGPAAAALNRLDGFPRTGTIEASTSTRRRPQALDIRLRRVTERVLEEATLIENIPTESVSRTILNLCGKKHRLAGNALDQALREGKVSLGELWKLIEAEWTTRRRGIAILYELVSERTPGVAPTDSELEDMYVRLTRRFSLPRGIEQWPMVLPTYGQAYFDFGYPLDNAAVEVNSYTFHLKQKERFDRDALKHRAAKLAGIDIIPLTSADLRWLPEKTAVMLRQLLPNSCAAQR